MANVDWQVLTCFERTHDETPKNPRGLASTIMNNTLYLAVKAPDSFNCGFSSHPETETSLYYIRERNSGRTVIYHTDEKGRLIEVQTCQVTSAEGTTDRRRLFSCSDNNPDPRLLLNIHAHGFSFSLRPNSSHLSVQSDNRTFTFEKIYEGGDKERPLIGFHQGTDSHVSLMALFYVAVNPLGITENESIIITQSPDTQLADEFDFSRFK